MTDLPRRVHIYEEGPREGFQIEKGPIATARKIELINALSHTGLTDIQIVCFFTRRIIALSIAGTALGNVKFLILLLLVLSKDGERKNDERED